MNAEELDKNVIGKDKSINYPVYVEKGTFSWDETENPTLKNISLKIKPKKLVAIVGQIGSGKTSFLSSILGDMEKLNGIVNINVSFTFIKSNDFNK